MDKKGKIIHWLNFALIVIVVYVLISQSGPTLQVKGSWHTGLIKNTYLEAQKDLLQQDIVVKGIGRYTVKQLAPNGGFFPKANSTCGKTSNNFQLWNKLEKECFPEYKKNAVALSEAILKEKLSSKKFINIKFNETLFTAKGSKKNINTNYARYFYDTSFAVDLGYEIKEYEKIKKTAQKLLVTCRNKRNLTSCIKKPVLWHYGSCENDQELDLQNRVVEFCVEGISSRLPLNYHFALDFTPTSPFEVENLLVSYNQNNNTYEISFDQDILVDGYNIYFTNILNLEDYYGKAKDVLVLGSLGQFSPEKIIIVKNEIIKNQSICNSLENNKAYLCDNKIKYILKNQLLEQGKDHSFSVTTIKDNQESNINGFSRASNIASTT